MSRTATQRPPVTPGPLGVRSDLIDIAHNERGWSEGQLAQHAGVAPATIERLLAGHVPSVCTQHKVAKALGIDPRRIVPLEVRLTRKYGAAA